MATPNVFSLPSPFTQHSNLAARKDTGGMLPVLAQHVMALTPFQAAQQQLVAQQMATGSAAMRNAQQQQQRVFKPATAMSPLHMAALGASTSQPLSRASSTAGMNSRNLSLNLDGNSCNSASTTFNEEHPSTSIFAPSAPAPARAPPRTSVRSLSNTLNRNSCPGADSGVSPMPPDQLSLTARRSSLVGLPQAGQTYPPHVGLPAYNHTLNQGSYHPQGAAAPSTLGATPEVHQQGMFSFGPTSMAAYAGAEPRVGPGGQPSTAAGAMGASLRRGPIMSLKDTPGSGSQQATQGSGQGAMATPRRSGGGEGLGTTAFGATGNPAAPLGAWPSTSSGMSVGSTQAQANAQHKPAGSVTPMPALRPSTSGVAAPLPVKPSSVAVARNVAAASSQLPSRLVGQAETGTRPSTRSGALPRVKLTAGGDPYEDPEEESPAAEPGAVRHWRHQHGGAAGREPQAAVAIAAAAHTQAAPPVLPRRPRDPEDDRSDVDDSRSQDLEMEASDNGDEYEEEPPPDPPSARTLKWLEETTMQILAKAKVPGMAVQLPRDSLF